MNDPLGLVLSRLGNVKRSGNSYLACCPAHGDGKPSLSVSEGTSKPVVLHCHAGCEPDAILAAIDLTWDQLNSTSDDGDWTPFGPAIDLYDYKDENGRLLFQVLRTVDKQFPQRRPDSTKKHGWSWKLGDTRRVLYRLSRVIEAVSEGRVIHVVEGEKDVHSIEAQGEVATCNPGGAGKWRTEYAEVLRDAHVKIIADADEPGRKHARQVVASLDGIAASVVVCEPAHGKDVTDHLRSGRKLSELEVTSETESKPELAQDIHELLNGGDDDYEWLIPGLLERGDRLVITGFEGWGKSTLMRQLAVTMAAGLNPFDRSKAPAAKVLYIDCENGVRHSRRKFRPLVEQAKRAGSPVPQGGLRVLFRLGGLHLPGDDDRLWLVERVAAYKPDVLIVGPFYRLHRSNPNDESACRSTVAALDEARGISGCSLIVEAHPGHGDIIQRSVRPRGSSLLMGWPEFGYGLQPDEKTDKKTRSPLNFISWRGDRDERNFPDHLTRGQIWPWDGVWDQSDSRLLRSV